MNIYRRSHMHTSQSLIARVIKRVKEQRIGFRRTSLASARAAAIATQRVALTYSIYDISHLADASEKQLQEVEAICLQQRYTEGSSIRQFCFQTPQITFGSAT